MRALAYLWKLIRALVGAGMSRNSYRLETSLVHRDFADVSVAQSSCSESNAAIDSATLSRNYEGDATTALAPSAEAEDRAETAAADEGLTDNLVEFASLNSTFPVDDLQRATTSGEMPADVPIPISLVHVGAPRGDEMMEAVVGDSAQSQQRTDTADETGRLVSEV